MQGTYVSTKKNISFSRNVLQVKHIFLPPTCTSTSQILFSVHFWFHRQEHVDRLHARAQALHLVRRARTSTRARHQGADLHPQVVGGRDLHSPLHQGPGYRLLGVQASGGLAEALRVPAALAGQRSQRSGLASSRFPCPPDL